MNWEGCGSGHGPFQDTLPAFSWKEQGKHDKPVRIAGLWAETLEHKGGVLTIQPWNSVKKFYVLILYNTESYPYGNGKRKSNSEQLTLAKYCCVWHRTLLYMNTPLLTHNSLWHYFTLSRDSKEDFKSPKRVMSA